MLIEPVAIEQLRIGSGEAVEPQPALEPRGRRRQMENIGLRAGGELHLAAAWATDRFITLLGRGKIVR